MITAGPHRACAEEVDDLLGPHPPEVVALIVWLRELREPDPSKRARKRRAPAAPGDLATELRVA
jgi:hypothetical protein